MWCVLHIYIYLSSVIDVGSKRGCDCVYRSELPDRLAKLAVFELDMGKLNVYSCST